MGLFTRQTERVPCTVEVSHRFESLHAHVRFNNGAVVYPGDEVLVHGAPVMAAFGEVIVEDRTATITLNRPDQLNAWTARMGHEVAAALAVAERDPAVVGIVITGAGRGFCAGADMNTLTAITEGGTLARDQGELPPAPASPAR